MPLTLPISYGNGPGHSSSIVNESMIHARFCRILPLSANTHMLHTDWVEKKTVCYVTKVKSMCESGQNIRRLWDFEFYVNCKKKKQQHYNYNNSTHNYCKIVLNFHENNMKTIQNIIKMFWRILVNGSHWLTLFVIIIFFHTVEVNGYQQQNNLVTSCESQRTKFEWFCGNM